MAEVGIISMVQNSGNFASEANGPDVPGTFISKASRVFWFFRNSGTFCWKVYLPFIVSFWWQSVNESSFQSLAGKSFRVRKLEKKFHFTPGNFRIFKLSLRTCIMPRLLDNLGALFLQEYYASWFSAPISLAFRHHLFFLIYVELYAYRGLISVD